MSAKIMNYIRQEPFIIEVVDSPRRKVRYEWRVNAVVKDCHVILQSGRVSCKRTAMWNAAEALIEIRAAAHTAANETLGMMQRCPAPVDTELDSPVGSR